ncbi:MAG: hypothetical protein JW990_04550, partial [Thermoleophilia bacterium]|nr:hypothetical protein [Thermoleophilia bacterium]
MSKARLLCAGICMAGLLLTTSLPAGSADNTAPAAAGATVEQLQQLVVQARLLLADGRTAEAEAGARRALSLARELEATAEVEALTMAALDVTTQAVTRTPAAKAPASGGDPFDGTQRDRAEALLGEMAALPRETDSGHRFTTGVYSPVGEAAIRSIMDQIDRDAVPQTALLTVPKYPSRLSQVVSTKAETDTAPKADWEQEIEAGLEQTVSFEFTRAPLTDV